MIWRVGCCLGPCNEVVRAREYVPAVTYRHIYRGARYEPEGYAVHPGTGGTTTRNGSCRSPRIAVWTCQDRAVRAQRNEHAAGERYRTEVADEPGRDRRRRSPCSHAGIRNCVGVVEVAREEGSGVADGYDPVEDRVVGDPIEILRPEGRVLPDRLGVWVITGVLGPARLSRLVAFMTNAYWVPFTRGKRTRGE